jgi:Fe2+ transport system protein B
MTINKEYIIPWRIRVGPILLILSSLVGSTNTVNNLKNKKQKTKNNNKNKTDIFIFTHTTQTQNRTQRKSNTQKQLHKTTQNPHLKLFKKRFSFFLFILQLLSLFSIFFERETHSHKILKYPFLILQLGSL